MSYHMPLDKNAYFNQFKTCNHGMTMHVWKVWRYQRGN